MLKGFFLRNAMLLEAAAEKFIWNERLTEVIIAAMLSMVPTFEGRYAITVMLGMGMPAGFAYMMAVVFSTGTGSPAWLPSVCSWLQNPDSWPAWMRSHSPAAGSAPLP